MKSMGLFDFLDDIPDDYEPKQVGKNITIFSAYEC
jgi:hypothetical protein